ncbi:MAG: hypothetical protein WB998_03560 [Solirubrobacteraceae bacterium]
MFQRPKRQGRGRRSPARVRVHELIATKAAGDKLGARGISTDEAEQIPRNHHVTVRNPREPTRGAKRHILIGCTDGGRRLTLVIERTDDPSVWLVVTGWPATPNERRILER